MLTADQIVNIKYPLCSLLSMIHECAPSSDLVSILFGSVYVSSMNIYIPFYPLNHLDLNNLLYCHQYGFQKEMFTENNRIHLTNTIRNALKTKSFSSSCFKLSPVYRPTRCSRRCRAGCIFMDRSGHSWPMHLGRGKGEKHALCWGKWI